MTIEEIFSVLIEHMVEGLMFHAQMADYYRFLGLEGFSECHKYHYFEENNNYRKLTEYYINKYNKLALERPFQNPHAIPEKWFLFTRQDVDEVTRKEAIQNGLLLWINWESNTKRFYERYYQELINLNEIASALELEQYILDVDKELTYAKNKEIYLKAMDYSISDILVDQESEKKKYQKQIKEIKL